MLKKTRQKELILRVLKSTPSHPTALWVYDEVRKEMPNISLATVYRNLKVLRETGQILELEFNTSPNRFDPRTDYHDHFICERCSLIRDIDEPVNHKRLNGRIARETGFKISYYTAEFRGLCRECQELEGDGRSGLETNGGKL
ncbi:MAG: transcriptional repressor [Dehalococcoidales bacterium]|nr:transcriptional repressor [Dehalococcoidales bacterium]MDZ4230344.1 transcriptional repressor [Dehalococcoidales bacterium]